MSVKSILTKLLKLGDQRAKILCGCTSTPRLFLRSLGHHACIGATLSDQPQKLQNRAARVITGRQNEHGQSELPLNKLKRKPLSERRTAFVANLMYKITHELALKRLSDIF